MPHVRILLCTYNGGAFLDDQLASFDAQSQNDWSLWASDDGSTDGTMDRLRHFRDPAGRPARIVGGPKDGFAANFLSLLCHADLPEGWVALSDQDDVWYGDKLSRALERLSRLPEDRPALACGRTMLTDGTLRPLGPSRQHRHFAFRNALVQNVVAGNTIVLNPAAHRLIRAAGRPAVPYHDWWVYLMVTGAGGTIVYDPVPCMDYRQHGRNVLGENRSLAAVTRRASSFAGRRWRGWFEANMAALRDNRHLLTQEHRDLVDRYFAQDRANAAGRTRALAAMRPYRQRRSETAALYAGSLLGLA